MPRRCWKCKETKPESNFSYSEKYKRFWAVCNQCTNKHLYELPVERRRELWREASRRRSKKDAEKLKTRAQTNKAIRDGQIQKKPCEVCGEEKSQAHHKDYSKPLEIMWLCHTHHRDEHYKIRYKPTL